jgi:hypothetical protein
MIKRCMALGFCAGIIAMLVPLQASAAVSGAIFTTRADGTEVNYNIYSDKNDVYLNGGPASTHLRVLPACQMGFTFSR